MDITFPRDVVPFVDILLAGLPVAVPRPTLTPRELRICVQLLGKGRTLAQALDTIQAQRPTLPFTHSPIHPEAEL